MFTNLGKYGILCLFQEKCIHVKGEGYILKDVALILKNINAIFFVLIGF